MGSYAQALQYKQALSDEELQGKISELVDNRKAIQAKLPTLLDDKGNPTPQYNEAITALTQNSKDLREIYHPDKNPSAISRYGHILTDALHITNAAQREKEQAAKQTALAAGDQRTAHGLAAAAPISPQQRAVQEEQTNNALNIQRVKDFRDNWKANNPGATPEQEATATGEYIQSVYGIKQTYAKPLSGTKPYKGSDGKYYQAVENPDGTTGAVAMPPDYAPPAQHSSTSQFNEELAAYAKAHNMAVEDLPPEALDYVSRRAAQARAMPSTTTTTTLKQNFDGQWVPVTEQNSRNPGSVHLVDPLGTSSEQHSESSKPKSSPAPKKHEPTKGTEKSGESTGSARKNSHTSVGAPVFAGKNKEYDDAKTAYHAAIDRTDTMEKNIKAVHESEKAGKGPDQQAMLSLVANHIGMTLGAQKGARINQAVWNEAIASAPWLESYYAKAFHNDPATGDVVFDGWKGGVTLTEDQMNQMVALAHDRLDTARDSLGRIRKELNQGVTNPSEPSPSEHSDEDIDAIINALGKPH